MLERCARTISTWLIGHQAIEPEDRELYEYAVCSLLVTVTPLILLLFIGAVTGRLSEGIMLVLPFMFIRKFSGGYHAREAWTCFVLSCGILTLCIYMTSIIVCGAVLHIVTLAAIVSLIVCSPVGSENRRLEPRERKRYKRVVEALVSVFGILYMCLHLAGADQYAVCISMGLLLSAGLQLPCLFCMVMSMGRDGISKKG